MSIDEFLRSKASADVRKSNLAPKPVEPPPVKEPGLLETGLRGVARGALGVYSGVGSAAEWAGDVSGSQGLRSFGTTLQDQATDEIQTGVGALNGPSFEGSFTENPSLKRTVGVVAQAVPSLGLAVATGGAATAGLRAAGLGLKAAQVGGAATAATGLGGIEGAPQYSEARKAGKSIGEASAVGAAATIGTALLEYQPIGKILGEASKGAVRTGLTGAVTEGLQEGTQTVWQNLVAKLGYDKSRSLAEGMVESMVGGAGAGGVVGGITGHVQQARDTATARTLETLMPEGAQVSVDNGMATVQAAGRSFQSPVRNVATALASGVSFDDLADAHTTLLDEVTTYLDAQQRQNTAQPVETREGPVQEQADTAQAVQVQELPKATNPPRFVKSDDQGLTYNMRGQDYTYAPLEGQTAAQLQEKIAGMPDAQAVAYLKQNASLVQQEEPTFSRKVTDIKGNKVEAPTVFYRGEREGGDRSVSGNAVWDSLLFASSDKSGADLYAGSAGTVTELRAKPETKILYEGTKEFRSLNKGNTFGGPKGKNLLDWAAETAYRAKEQGYDAVWFKRQSDVGTAIINRSAFEGEADLNFMRENIPQSPATLGTETDTPEIQVLHKGIADYLNTRIAPGTFAQAETPEAMKRLTPLLEIRLGKKIVYFTAKDAPMQIAGVTGIADDTIYINADAKTPHLAVVGHEFLHELKRSDKEAYSGILQAVQKIMPQEQFEAMQGKLDSARSAEGKSTTSQTLVHEELTADYFGEQFMTKQFWEKAQRNHPQQFVSLAQRFVQFVQKVKDTFTGKQLTDIEKAQDAAVGALRKYAKKNGLDSDPRFMRGETSPAGEPATEATFSRMDEAGATTDKQRAEAKRLWQEKGVESPYFKKWFGDSVATVDGKPGGGPLVVYHGTPTGGFDVFDPAHQGRTGGRARGGFSFTTNRAAAEEYANAYADDTVALDEGIMVANKAMAKANDSPAVMEILRAKHGADETAPEFYWGAIDDNEEFAEYLGEVSKDIQGVDAAIADELAQAAEMIRGGIDREAQVYEVYLQVPAEAPQFQATPETLGEVVANLDVRDAPGRAAVVNMPDGERVFYVADSTQIKSATGNLGTFDAANPDITFSRMDAALKQGQQQLERAAKVALNPKAKLHQLTIEHAPKWLSVTPLQTVVKLFEKTVPQVKSIYDRLNQTVTIKNDLVDVAYVLRDEAHKLATKTVGVDTFNKAAELGTFNRMLPWEDIYAQEWVPATGTKQQRLQQAQEAWVAAGMQKDTKLTFVQAYAESREAYDALKHDELKQAYKSAVDYMKNTRNRERDNLLAYIESVSDEGTALRKQLMQRFEASFSDIQGAYWPLSRFGDFTLSYTDTNGFRIFKTFPTYADALQVQEALIAGGEVEAGNINVSRKDAKTAAETAIPGALMSQLQQAVQAKYTEGLSTEDEVAYDNALQRAQSTVQEMNQIWLRWQPETTALKNSMRRGNVKGYDPDMLRGFLNYVQHHASRIAWSEQGRKIEQDMQEMAAEVSELGKGEGATDTALQQAILNDMRLRLQTIKTAKVGWAASSLGKLGTANFMTSPSIALVQMSQLAVLTLPKLATMYSIKGAGSSGGGTTSGWADAFRVLSKGSAQAFSKQYNRDAMFADADVNRLYDMMREAVSQQTRQEGQRIGEPRYTEARISAEITKLTPEQQRLLALREAMARNLLDISATHEAYELTQGKNPDSPLRKAFYYAMAPMRLSELASRKTAVLATFELATEQGKDFFGAMDDIAEVVDGTLHSYAKENKGWRMQGGLARVLLMFRHYQIMTGIRMIMLFKDSIKGETAEVRSLARREFVGIMGMTGLLAGSLGLPLSQTIFAILDMVLGDDDEPMDSQLEFTNWLNATLGETAGNVAAKGLPTLMGMDLSRRIGLQDIYGMGQDAPAQLHGSSLAAWHAAHMLGPTYSVFEGWFKGYDQMMNKGNYMRGLEEATPKPIRDMLKAYRTATEGVKTTSGKRLVADEDMGVDEIISMALGFYPDELATAQANQSALLKMSTRISERRGKLIRQAASAIMEGGDPMEAYEGIRTFNSKMPRFKIGSGDVRSAIKARSKGELGTTGVRERAVAQQYGIDALGVE